MGKQIKIAIVPSKKFGDGLLFLVIANNLQRNGYQVTFYSDYLAQLQQWLPEITVCPITYTEETLQKISTQYDITIIDAINIARYIPNMSYDKLKQYGILMFLDPKKIDDNIVKYNEQKLKEKFVEQNTLKKALPFAKISEASLRAISKTLPLAKTMEIFCKEILKLENSVKDIGLTPPKELSHRKHKKRIIIHPTSGNPSKNWSPQKFIKFAKTIKKQGWDPIFTVSPEELPEWELLIKNEFTLPVFKNINELATFLYESFAFVGNDSGTGHLASALGIPTLTIRRNTSKKPNRWQPGWSYNETVHPWFRIKIGKKKYWQWFLSIKTMLNAFQRLIQQ